MVPNEIVTIVILSIIFCLRLGGTENHEKHLSYACV